MTNGTRTSETRTTSTKTRKAAKQQLTCFIVTGFGNKTDYSTGRVLNLDKTYEQLIRPACDKADVNCFRAIDANLTGSIDSIMYRWIYQADIVIADLSTLNSNVFYELGVRHAQRPNTTIVIAESVLMQKIPFDLSSFVIHQYEHGGEEISAKEQKRFIGHLSKIIEKIIAAEKRRQATSPDVRRESDSPVFKFLNGMTPPAYDAETYVEPPVYIPPAQRKKRKAEVGQSLASVIDAAEAAKKNQNFPEAIRLIGQAIEMQTEGNPEKKPDVFLAQRLALVTYKAGEKKDTDGNVDKETAIAALGKAEDILAKYCAPKISNDPETLGLSGAINKRFFELTGDLEYLDRAIGFYERGFYVKQDYYNGINVAYMYTQRANLLSDRFDAIVSYGHANMIRQKVADICSELIDDEKGFASRGDKQWVYLTLAEAYQGLGQTSDEERLGRKIDREATEFAKSSYLEQKAKLKEAIDAFERKVRPAEQDYRNARRGYYGMISYVDDLFGRVMSALEDSGFGENTVVVFASDHGDMIGERGMWFKKTLYDPAIKVPLVIAHPDHDPGRVVGPVSLLDIFPTLLGFAGIEEGEIQTRIDGKSLVPALNGDAIPGPVLVEHIDGGTAAPRVTVRDGSKKLTVSRAYPNQFYDLATDPFEQRNIAGSGDPDEARLMHLVEETWPLERLAEDVIRSQTERKLIDSALSKGREEIWDFVPRPLTQNSNYVRRGDAFPDVERRGYLQYPSGEKGKRAR